MVRALLLFLRRLRAARMGSMSEILTLAVDCGGGGIKASVLDENGTMIAPAVRTVTPYPLPPALLVDTIVDLAAHLPHADRVTVGMPLSLIHI